MYQVPGTEQDLELDREEGFCKLGASAAGVMREHGAMAYALYTILATNARVTRKGDLCARESTGSLVKLTGFSESAVRRNLNKLKAAGLLRQWFANNNNSYFFLTTGHGVERFDSAERRAEAQEIPAGAGAVDNQEAQGSEKQGGAVDSTPGGFQNDTPLYIDFKKLEQEKGSANTRFGENQKPGSQGNGDHVDTWTSEYAAKLRRKLAVELGRSMEVPLEIQRSAREQRCL